MSVTWDIWLWLISINTVLQHDQSSLLDGWSDKRKTSSKGFVIVIISQQTRYFGQSTLSQSIVFAEIVIWMKDFVLYSAVSANFTLCLLVLQSSIVMWPSIWAWYLMFLYYEHSRHVYVHHKLLFLYFIYRAHMPDEHISYFITVNKTYIDQWDEMESMHPCTPVKSNFKLVSLDFLQPVLF